MLISLCTFAPNPGNIRSPGKQRGGFEKGDIHGKEAWN